MNKGLRSGLIGVAILVTLNAIGYFVLAQPAAVAFSDRWWSTWSPGYAVCLVLLVYGALATLRRRSERAPVVR